MSSAKLLFIVLRLDGISEIKEDHKRRVMILPFVNGLAAKILREVDLEHLNWS